MPVLLALAAGLFVIALAAQLTRRLPAYRVHGLFAVAYFLSAAQDMQDGSTWMACCSASAGALFAWLWWHGGGGNDTKRKLRKARAKFVPTRRTAPVTA